MIDEAAGEESVAIDLSFLRPPEDKSLPDLFTAYTGELLDAVEARWVTRELAHGSWPMLVLERRR
jgi:hypothetical protein